MHQDTPDKPRNLFLLGITQRCGTNFLHDLLCRHPDCGTGAAIREDHLLGAAAHLVRYAAAVGGRWDPAWGGGPGLRPLLETCLGNGLREFLRRQGEAVEDPQRIPEAVRPMIRQHPRYLVARTPGVDGLEYYRRLFGDTPLILLVRDGRAVTESLQRSFRWRFRAAARTWNDAALRIRRVLGDPALRPERVHLVRYEALYTDTRRTLLELFRFLDLDPDRYDFAAAAEQPVRGSSTHARSDGEAVHWTPAARDETFRPLERWHGWSRWRRRRFVHLAGAGLAALGYPVEAADRPGLPGTLLHRACDLAGAQRDRLSELLRGGPQ